MGGTGSPCLHRKEQTQQTFTKNPQAALCVQRRPVQSQDPQSSAAQCWERRGAWSRTQRRSWDRDSTVQQEETPARPPTEHQEGCPQSHLCREQEPHC